MGGISASQAVHGMPCERLVRSTCGEGPCSVKQQWCSVKQQWCSVKQQWCSYARGLSQCTNSSCF